MLLWPLVAGCDICPRFYDTIKLAGIIIAQYDRNVNLIISIVLNLYTSLTCRSVCQRRARAQKKKKTNRTE